MSRKTKLKPGDIRIFRKSGQEVRVVELSQSNPREWVVERTKGAAKGKRMICPEHALVLAGEGDFV
jgi:hypothetical protein